MASRARHVRYVWMNGYAVGRWQFTASTGHTFCYADTWLDSPVCRPLSLSLPLRPADDPWRGMVVQHFFDNLLPENPQHRQRLRLALGCPSSSSFDLFGQIGLDCPGAVQITRQDSPPATPSSNDARPLSEKALDQLLSSLRQSAPQLVQNSPSAQTVLAGSHDKTALLWHHGRWHLPDNGLHSSHILKLSIDRHADNGFALSGSLENSWLCHRLAQAFGINMATCELLHIAGHKVLAISRLDRQWSEEEQRWQGVAREDFCQVFGLSPDMKYQVNGAQHASKMSQQLLGSVQADADRLAFARQLLVFWLLCAFDAHAKRFAIQLLPAGRFQLAPPLGVLSAYPLLGAGQGKLSADFIRPALGLAAQSTPSRWNSLSIPDWLAFAKAAAIPKKRMEALMAELGGSALHITAQVRKQLPAAFPVAIAEPILQGIVHAARSLREAC